MNGLRSYRAITFNLDNLICRKYAILFFWWNFEEGYLIISWGYGFLFVATARLPQDLEIKEILKCRGVKISSGRCQKRSGKNIKTCGKIKALREISLLFFLYRKWQIPVENVREIRKKFQHYQGNLKMGIL